MGGRQANGDRLNSPHLRTRCGNLSPGLQRLELARDESVPHQSLKMTAVDLASLLCSRLCHDLMSPVGAFNNGIELFADETDPDMREKYLALLAESARPSAYK